MWLDILMNTQITPDRIYGLNADWNCTDEGDTACYTTDPAEVAPEHAARVIYELRADVGRLNTEVMVAMATIRELRAALADA